MCTGLLKTTFPSSRELEEQDNATLRAECSLGDTGELAILGILVAC
jgi:hypothetical protein